MDLSRKIKAGALIAAALAFTGCGTVNIGYVDGAKVMSEAPQIKNIMDEGAKKIEELQQEAAAEIENNPDWTDEEINKARTDTQRKLIGINQAYATQLQHKLNEALAVIAQEKKLDVVVDSSESQPIVLEGGIDLTAEVIQKLQ